MKKFLSISGFVIMLLASRVFAQSDSSRVLDFLYGNYGDTIVAFLNIKVLTPDSSGGENKYLENVVITITEKGSNETTTDTIANGKKYFAFRKGMFSILISKTGYQSILITNYKSDPDQFSWAYCLLVKGEGVVRFDTKPKPDPVPKNGIDTFYFDNHQIRAIVAYKNDKIMRQIWYYENGALRRNMQRICDTIDCFVEYYPDGVIKSIGTYNEDLTIGFGNDYHPDGKLRCEVLNSSKGQICWTVLDSLGNYEVKDGNSIRSYYRKHHIKQKFIYPYRKNGREHGTWIWNNRDGTKYKKFRYRNGQLRSYKYWSDGKLYSKSTYNRKGEEKQRNY